jgi:1-acyl-sn-glycerol-3-phosphate acyltransferase
VSWSDPRPTQRFLTGLQLPHAAGPDQGGAGLLALTSGVPVIPIRTWGLERGGAPWWHRRRVTVAVGSPVDLTPALGVNGRNRHQRASTLALEAVRAMQRPPRPPPGAWPSEAHG